MTTTKPELTAEEEVQRLKEDHLAKNHCGFFKLWKTELEPEPKHSYSYNRKPREWIKTEVLGIFPSREPCEQFLELIEWGPEAVYEFVSFNRDLDLIPGRWDITLDKDGVLQPNEGMRRNAKWEWGWGKADIHAESGRSWGDSFSGKARTKARAIELAQQAKIELEAFIRDERPKRAEGCSCTPWSDKPCSKCEKAEKERKKKACGCPHCEGDHTVTDATEVQS